MDYSILPPDRLIRSCLETGAAAAWEEFIRRYDRVITGAVIRACLLRREASRELIEDLTQEVYFKLCRQSARWLDEFSPAHPEALPGYLKVVAANTANDYFRTQHARKRGGGGLVQSLDDADLPLPQQPSRLSDPERAILLREIGSMLETYPEEQAPRDKRIFHLYYRLGMTAKSIASLPGIAMNVKGVESVIYRITQFLRERAGTKQKGISTGGSL